MRPERPGAPFKRRAMENYVVLYSIYAFTSSVAQVFVQNTLKIDKTRQQFENDPKTLEHSEESVLKPCKMIKKRRKIMQKHCEII